MGAKEAPPQGTARHTLTPKCKGQIRMYSRWSFKSRFLVLVPHRLDSGLASLGRTQLFPPYRWLKDHFLRKYGFIFLPLFRSPIIPNDSVLCFYKTPTASGFKTQAGGVREENGIGRNWKGR